MIHLIFAFLVTLTPQEVVSSNEAGLQTHNRKHVEALIRKLGDEDYPVREAATETLLRMGKERAKPILEKGVVHRDPEIRARARWIVKYFAVQEMPKVGRSRGRPWWLRGRRKSSAKKGGAQEGTTTPTGR